MLVHFRGTDCSNKKDKSVLSHFRAFAKIFVIFLFESYSHFLLVWRHVRSVASIFPHCANFNCNRRVDFTISCVFTESNQWREGNAGGMPKGKRRSQRVECSCLEARRRGLMLQCLGVLQIRLSAVGGGLAVSFKENIVNRFQHRRRVALTFQKSSGRSLQQGLVLRIDD